VRLPQSYSRIVVISCSAGSCPLSELHADVGQFQSLLILSRSIDPQSSTRRTSRRTSHPTSFSLALALFLLYCPTVPYCPLMLPHSCPPGLGRRARTARGSSGGEQRGPGAAEPLPGRRWAAAERPRVRDAAERRRPWRCPRARRLQPHRESQPHPPGHQAEGRGVKAWCTSFVLLSELKEHPLLALLCSCPIGAGGYRWQVAVPISLSRRVRDILPWKIGAQETWLLA